MSPVPLSAATIDDLADRIPVPGYDRTGLQHGTGDFDAASPAVQHDLKRGATPRTVFGLIAALRRRRTAA
jgi:hypothetical protein